MEIDYLEFKKALEKAKRRLVGPGFEEYTQMVQGIRQAIETLPNEETARDIYRECLIAEMSLRVEISKKEGKDDTVYLVDTLEKQEKGTEKVRKRAKEKGWDLTPVDNEFSYQQDGRQR